MCRCDSCRSAWSTKSVGCGTKTRCRRSGAHRGSTSALQCRDQAGRARSRHAHAVPDLWLAEGGIQVVGGGKPLPRWPRCATRPIATMPVAWRRSCAAAGPHSSGEEPREPPGAGAARQPQGDPHQVRGSGERAARPAEDLRGAAASRVGHGSFDEAVRQAISAGPLLARALEPLLDARTVLYKTYLRLDNAVKAVVRTDPVCQRLMTVPGSAPSPRSPSRPASTMSIDSAPPVQWRRTSG